MPIPTPRPAIHAGLLLLACWLGWTATSFAALGRRPVADEATVAALLDALAAHGRLPPSGTATALRLPVPTCDCPLAESAWQDTRTAMQRLGGAAGSVPALAVDGGGHELLVLAANGQPVYAGPLLPPAATCGGTNGITADWLAPLLAGDVPPLFLPSRCSC